MRVSIIGAFGDEMGIGAAYLFGTNGALLTTFTNLAPTSYCFGSSVASIGSDGVLVGSPEGYPGAVYLFSPAVQTPGVPSLTIYLTTTNTVAVSWPWPSTNWILQQNTNSVNSVNWSNITTSIQDDGNNKTLIVDTPTGERFYRLFRP